MKKITFTADQRKKTFTIWVTHNDGSSTKYRTLPMDKDEFESNEGNTQNDWSYFLRSQDGSYYKV